MTEIIVKSQAELDALPIDYDGRIIIEFGTPANRAVVNRRFKRSVVARGNSSVVARGNSSVVARGNSSVEARGNSQITDRTHKGDKLTISGNARIVHDPHNIEEYLDFHGLEAAEHTVRLFKAVHKAEDGRYLSDFNRRFTYTIGATVAPEHSFNSDPEVECGSGIHMAHKEWCVSYGRGWEDMAILELEVNKEDVLVPAFSNGKVRASRATVIREVPFEECGLTGKIYAKKR